MHRIEPLEVRIAPATILPGDKILTYTDIDGDKVTIKASLPVLQSFQFLFDSPYDSEGPQQLRRIDFVEGSVGTFSLTMTVKRGPQGDGLANVGEIVTDEDMLSITIKGDLGRITVGDSEPEGLGLKTLNVASLGTLGVATQGLGGTVVSNIKGGLGALKVRNDIAGVLNVLDATTVGSGTLGTAMIGGSLLGNDAVLGGVVSTGGDIGSITVKGNVRGGGIQASGQISAGGSIEKVVIGGSLIGNSGGNGQSFIEDARAGSGTIVAGTVLSLIGSIGSVTIGGDMHGDSGTGSGSIVGSLGEGEIGSVTVKGSIVGGSGFFSGAIFSNTTLGKLTVGGSIIGKNGNYSVSEDVLGQVLVNGRIGPVKITGDVMGGSSNGSGRIHAGETISSLAIGGSLIAGEGFKSGSIHSLDVGKITVKRNLDGRDNPFSQFPMIEGRNIAGLSVGGFLEKGIIYAQQQLGAVVIGGSMINSQIFGVGLNDQGGVDLAIKSVKVTGSVINSEIVAGLPLAPGPSVNADAQIGAITVGGDWIASSVAAGAFASDGFYGDGNDAAVNAPNDPAVFARIASIAIAGQVFGSAASGDHFGFVAQEIGSIKIGGYGLSIEGGPGNDVIELSLVTDDVTVRELPTL